MNKLLIAFIFYFLATLTVSAQRQKISLNQDWKFTPGYVVQKNVFTNINIPHTWNTKDALGGNLDYYRGIGNYEHTLDVK